MGIKLKSSVQGFQKGNHQSIMKKEILDTDKKINIKDEVKKTSKIIRKAIVINIPKKQNETIVKGLSEKFAEKSKHYNNFEVVLTNSNATPIRSQDGFAYYCCFCSDQYTDPAELKTHTLANHTNAKERRGYMTRQCSSGYLLKLDITQLACNLCHHSINTLEDLFDHLQNEHKKIIYTDIKNQIVPFKFGGESLQCSVCSMVFSKFKLLLEHMHTHYRNFVCEVCDYGFINRKALLNHQESHKTGAFKCNECIKVFTTLQRKNTHEKAVHKYKNLAHKCGVCNERFKSTQMKDKHMTTSHGMSPVIRKCLACNKTFTNARLLRTHVQRFHLMERRFKCTECEMTFYTSKELKDHKLKHTGQRDFQCDICLKWYTRKCALKEHMRIHLNDKRFTCVHCGRGFVQKCSWRSHMRTVHGEIYDRLAS